MKVSAQSRGGGDFTGFEVQSPDGTNPMMAMAEGGTITVGAALEAALESRWGGPLLNKAPELKTTELAR